MPVTGGCQVAAFSSGRAIRVFFAEKSQPAIPGDAGDAPQSVQEAAVGSEKQFEAAVNCCYFPLYEVERGITSLSYDPEKKDKKATVDEWLGMMGRTKHLCGDKYSEVRTNIQNEIDRRWKRLKLLSEHPDL